MSRVLINNLGKSPDRFYKHALYLASSVIMDVGILHDCQVTFCASDGMVTVHIWSGYPGRRGPTDALDGRSTQCHGNCRFTRGVPSRYVS